MNLLAKTLKMIRRRLENDAFAKSNLNDNRCFPKADFITGETINMNGGIYMNL